MHAHTLDKALNAMRCLGEMVIHCELHFSQRLDRQRLALALDRLFDAEPILACRFVRGNWRDCWQTVAPEQRRALLLADSAEAFDTFKVTPHDSGAAVALRVCLWSAPDEDRLLIKISHEAADAGGLKEAVYRLAAIYRRLQGEPDYRPAPNTGSRSLWQALRRIPAWRFPQILGNYYRQMFNHLRYRPAFRLPLAESHQEQPFYGIRHIAAARLQQAVARHKPSGATINDLVLTAFTRALMLEGGWDGSSHLRTMYTVDFRRYYLPQGQAEAVTNLLGFEYLNLGKHPGATAEETLAKVSAQCAARKRNFPGASDAVSGALLPLTLLPAKLIAPLAAGCVRLGTRARLVMDCLTNMGPIDTAAVTFDQAPSAAWLIVPPVYPPMLAMGISGYNGGITISCGGYRPSHTPELLEKLFDRIEAELPGLPPR